MLTAKTPVLARDALQLFAPQDRWHTQNRNINVLAPSTRNRLAEIETIANRANFPLRLVGVAQRLEEPIAIAGPGSDWLVMPLELDPNVRRNAGYPIPRHAVEDLQFLCDVGLDCWDSLTVAHETLDGYRAPLTRRIDTRVVRANGAPGALNWARGYGSAALSILKYLSLPLLGIAAIAAVAAAPLAIAATAVDPILMGSISDERTGLDVYVALTKWDSYH